MQNVHRTYGPEGEPTDQAVTMRGSTMRGLTMRAVVHDGYRMPPALAVRNVDVPVPAAGQVLVEVAAASINPLDWHFATGRPYFLRLLFGFRRPKQATRGADVAGRVVALGEGVTSLRVGDRVAGAASGSFAEFAVARATGLAVVPEQLADHEAAAIPIAGVTALQALRDQGEVTAGQRVLVIGAAGGVGVYAVQLAVAMGAVVTGVCSGRNVDLVRSLGATNVIDYESGDWADGTQYDVIIDNVATRRLGVCRRALTDDGTYVMVGGPKSNPWIDPLGRVIAAKVRFALRPQRFRDFTAATTTEELRLLWDYVQAGQLRPVVGQRIELDDVPAAVAGVATGRASGKVVVDVAASRDDPAME